MPMARFGGAVHGKLAKVQRGTLQVCCNKGRPRGLQGGLCKRLWRLWCLQPLRHCEPCAAGRSNPERGV